MIIEKRKTPRPVHVEKTDWNPEPPINMVEVCPILALTAFVFNFMVVSSVIVALMVQ